jgi:hypothetical protein
MVAMTPSELVDLIERLRIRAQIRRQIPGRKSVIENRPDRLADLLDEAASAFELIDKDRCEVCRTVLWSGGRLQLTRFAGELPQTVWVCGPACRKDGEVLLFGKILRAQIDVGLSILTPEPSTEKWRQWVWSIQSLMHEDNRAAHPIVLLADVDMCLNGGAYLSAHFAALEQVLREWRDNVLPPFEAVLSWEDRLQAAGMDTQALS